MTLIADWFLSKAALFLCVYYSVKISSTLSLYSYFNLYATHDFRDSHLRVYSLLLKSNLRR